MDNMNIRKINGFTVQLVADGVYAIDEFGIALMYLIIGKTQALLLDTGVGAGNVHAVVKELTDLPCMVVNSHHHYDHAGGNVWFDTYVADGILVSTPTGSTAYNLSAAGPVLVPSMEAMIITPICPHSLNKRSLVVSSDSKLRIEVGKTKENYQDEAAIRGDGQMLWTVSTGDVVWIEKAKETFDMVRLGDASFFDKMRSKLNRN